MAWRGERGAHCERMRTWRVKVEKADKGINNNVTVLMALSDQPWDHVDGARVARVQCSSPARRLQAVLAGSLDGGAC